MKLGLGGILTCCFAFLVTGLVAIGHVGSTRIGADLKESRENTIFILSLPLGWLSGIGSVTHPGRDRYILYLLLMIPNSFLWGYSLAAVIRQIGRLIDRTKDSAK